MQVVKLFDENALLLDLQSRTIELIHATTVIDAIKKLVSAYDIIALNLAIKERFKQTEDDPIWDMPALIDLNRTRIELIIYHRFNFKPTTLLEQYSGKVVSFLHLIQVKNDNHKNKNPNWVS